MLNKLISNRGSMYGFLSRIYREEVDQELLNQMIKMDLFTPVDPPEINEGYRTLKNYLEHQTENSLFDLATDYAGIFVVAGAKGDCAYPYESVYVSPLKLVMQDSRDQVLKLYRESGLDKSPDSNEPEDHIAFELEFMSYLCQKTAAALGANNFAEALSYLKKQKYFLEKHLTIWIPSFCKDVERLAGEDFYKAIAKITIGFLNLERHIIGDLIDTAKTS